MKRYNILREVVTDFQTNIYLVQKAEIMRGHINESKKNSNFVSIPHICENELMEFQNACFGTKIANH